MVVYSITDSADMNLSNLWEMVKDRDTWCAAVSGVAESQAQLSDWVKKGVCVCVCICVSVLLSQSFSPSPSPPVSTFTSGLYIYISISACKQAYLYHFSRFHTYVLIYDSCTITNILTHTRTVPLLCFEKEYAQFVWTFIHHLIHTYPGLLKKCVKGSNPLSSASEKAAAIYRCLWATAYQWSRVEGEKRDQRNREMNGS